MKRLLPLTLVAILFANLLGTSSAYSQFDDFPGFGFNEPWQSAPITLTPLSMEEESQRASMVKILERPVSLSEREWMLEDLLESIERQLFIEIVPDMPALRDWGIDLELEQIDIPSNCKQLAARTVLDYVLSDIGMTWLVEGGLFIVTTTERAESLQVAKKYDVTDLVRSEETGVPFEVEVFLDLITETVEPESWDTWGGPGRIETTNANGLASFTVQQTRPVLEKIEELLAELRRLNVPQAERPLPSWVAEDALILRRLETQMVADYMGTPLDDIAEDIGESIGVPVFFHINALRDWGIDTEIELIDFGVRTMQIGDALDVILSDLGLTYGWREGALWITTIDAMWNSGYMSTRFYDVSNLLDDYEEGYVLIDLITETIEPECWDSWGGPGTVSEIELRHGCFFVIRQSGKTHRLIEQFLGELEMVSFGETVEDDPRWAPIVSQVESERVRAVQMNTTHRRENANRPPPVQTWSDSGPDPFGGGDSEGIDPFALAP